MKDMQDRGILNLIAKDGTTIPLDSTTAHELVQQLTTKIYEGTIKTLNDHRAPDLPPTPEITPTDIDALAEHRLKVAEQWNAQQALLPPKPGPARRS